MLLSALRMANIKPERKWMAKIHYKLTIKFLSFSGLLTIECQQRELYLGGKRSLWNVNCFYRQTTEKYLQEGIENYLKRLKHYLPVVVTSWMQEPVQIRVK